MAVITFVTDAMGVATSACLRNTMSPLSTSMTTACTDASSRASGSGGAATAAAVIRAGARAPSNAERSFGMARSSRLVGGNRVLMGRGF